MTNRIFVFVAAFVIAGQTASAQASVSDSTLTAAHRLYDGGSYESAELVARRLMEQGPIADSIRIEAERVIAFSLVAQGKTELARDHFESILALNPSFQLDPVLTSPKILTVFAEAKMRFTSARRADAGLSTNPQDEVRDITFRAVLFPGWEQYYHGRTESGLLLAGAGVLSLGSAITFEFLRAPARRDYLAATQPADIANKYTTYNRYYRAEVYSLIAFGVVYIASEFDVFLHGDRSVQIQPTSDQGKGSGLLLSLRW
jgi:hypothetical protein